ncbi:MAG: 2-oxoacid:acceptor oxidoreductase subunit alpha [Desulfobulbaceae bacterium]|nr:2-oxoacid:acceptor oxidoreductase subunit alpha [Desulfobulbaceae bacterium]
MDYSIRIAGEAGQGLQTIGAALGKIFSRLGYHVFTHQDYMSRVRGGHNYYQIRLSEKAISASRDVIHILVALNIESIDMHRLSLHSDGIILYEPQNDEEEEDEQFLATAFTQIAKDAGGNKIMANVVAVGAILGLFGFDLQVAEEIIKESLAKKSGEIIEGNLKAMQAGSDYVRKNCRKLDRFQTVEAEQDNLMLINGVQAIGAGAVMSGVRFYAAYPMTPSTGIMVYLAGKAVDFGIIVEQAEDEISAINMALGASYAGIRAMTGTSGGGFALMTEGVSLAGITETPIVIAEMQRPGPATGLPTRTEQSDLDFVIHGGHGEFPRVVLTPGTPEQAFYAANKAFDLAEKYQIPVFIQADQYLGDTEWTYRDFDLSDLSYKDYRLRHKDLAELKDYKRYAVSSDGISPMAVPGESRHLVVVDSDEHDEDGHIIEDAETRIRMFDKRLHAKMERLRKEISPPVLYGERTAPEIILVCFGSTYGVIREAVDILGKDYSLAMLHFSEVYPFPALNEFDYADYLRKARSTVCIENNATGQFNRLLRAEMGIACSSRINRYDGRPFTLESLVEEIRQRL